LSLLWVGNALEWHQVPFPAWLAALTGFNLLVNIVTHWYCSLYCARLYRTGRRHIITAGMLYPLYLVLHSIASYKALWQLFVKPHFWEKTTHGLARNFQQLATRTEASGSPA
jgi:hypothetical protein